MRLTDELEWEGRTIRCARSGEGPPVVMCHGTPWSSALWRPFAEALSARYTVHLWDMPGYGESSKRPEHRVGLDVQGEAFAALLAHWGLEAPHVVAHDYGGAVALRAHLLHGRAFASLVLADVVTLSPWGSDFFRLVREHQDVWSAAPPAVHEGALRSYITGASHRGLTQKALDELVAPWLGAEGQPAFYRQVAQGDQQHTEVLEPLLPQIDHPVLVVWGREDTWLPVDHAHRLAELVPGARLRLIDGAGHLVHLDQPVALATTLAWWLGEQAG